MPGEKEKKTKGFSFLKLALFLLIVILVAGVALYSFMGINPADMLVDGFAGLYNRVLTVGAEELTETVKQIITYDSSERLSCTVVSNDLAVATISSVKIYDSEGREKGYIPVNLKKPYVQAYKKDILVADLEGRYFGLINEGKLLWEKSTDEDIVNANLSENWILLITKSKQSGYKRTVRAYSRDGQEVSMRIVSDYYPYAVFHYPEFNETSFVIAGMEASGLEANSLFEFLDPSMNQKASIRGNKEVFAEGIPLKKNSLLLYGEHSLISVDPTYKTLWEKEITDATITCANAIQQQYPVVAELNSDVLAREKKYETTVRILESNGSEKASLVLDAMVTGIASTGRTAALKAGSEVFFINAAGEVMDHYTANADIAEVYLAGEDLAYIVSAGTINRIKVKVTNKFLGIF